ncbi:MAG TPA: caspase family protein [Blastocatellia bacterium]|nr:caspase family protein [Blastocatellia bacterium]HMV84062.1 caspase family protein [Blastocatellia bacterium]HMX26539.1 caspase family protein [Blastocatellia bacterium]HMZ19557.1 caspase family protein [Blastocatellia bacterium]HNG29126.1 caspase family protein [Blastocatellia bacterium]
MPKGISLHIGLNKVDPAHYDGWNGALTACEFDAKDMAALAKAQKFKTKTLLTAQATADAVITAVTDAANQLKAGDFFLFTYSGHGGQVPDKNGDEKDGLDETWVLYDRELIDDELYRLWALFAPGVRILVLSDSCHSGTVTRARLYEAVATQPEIEELAPPIVPRFRVMPGHVNERGSLQNRVYTKNKELYDGIQKQTRAGDTVAVNASVLLISGCQDNQLSSDGNRNGLFTQMLLKTWNKGEFSGSYSKFHKTILQRMPPWQSPNFYRAGARDARFEAESPFTV